MKNATHYNWNLRRDFGWNLTSETQHLIDSGLRCWVSLSLSTRRCCWNAEHLLSLIGIRFKPFNPTYDNDSSRSIFTSRQSMSILENRPTEVLNHLKTHQIRSICQMSIEPTYCERFLAPQLLCCYLKTVLRNSSKFHSFHSKLGNLIQTKKGENPCYDSFMDDLTESSSERYYEI